MRQPHVRPIVRGKVSAPVEFGAKLSVSVVNGYIFTEKLEWDDNEGSTLIDAQSSSLNRIDDTNTEGSCKEEADKVFAIVSG